MTNSQKLWKRRNGLTNPTYEQIMLRFRLNPRLRRVYYRTSWLDRTGGYCYWVVDRPSDV